MSALHPAMLDARAPTPLYHQIYLILRERIVSRALAGGALLQGEEEMARSLGVSRITVKRALNELAADGLVARRRGRGSVVIGGEAIAPLVTGAFDTLLEGLVQMGLETRVELLDVAEQAAGDAVAARLDLEPDDRVQRVVRLRHLRDEPFSYLVTHVPLAIAQSYSRDDLAHLPFLTLLERAGAKPQEAEQWIGAIAAAPPIAKALAVPAGSPLLRIERVMRGPRRRPVQLIEGCYRPDRFQYHFSTRRRAKRPNSAWAVDG